MLKPIESPGCGLRKMGEKTVPGTAGWVGSLSSGGTKLGSVHQLLSIVLIESREIRASTRNPRGRFSASYRFRFPGPAVYGFRALAEPEADYPFATGVSSRVVVRER